VKALAQRARPAASAPRAVRRAAARASAHEQQADRAASGFARGDTGLHRLLTPATPAAFAAPDSLGGALPHTLRSELERAFDANLAAVRLHRDTAAAHAAQQFGARAFASGAHVYFGAGAYSPDTRGGRALLAHEIAHVLQQTGRRSAGAVLAATGSAGIGTVQCADLPDFPALRTLHAPSDPDSADGRRYEKVADALRAVLAAKNPDAALVAFVEKEFSSIKDWPAQAESLLYDTLKSRKQWSKAAALIARDEFKGGARIRTALWSGPLLTALRDEHGGETAFAQSVDHHPVLIRYATGWVDTVADFLTQSVYGDISIPVLRRLDKPASGDADASIFGHTRLLSDVLDDPTRHSMNEWAYEGMLVLNAFDRLRQRRLVAIANAAIKANNADRNEPLIVIKRRMAEGVRDWLDRLVADAHDADGLRQHRDSPLDAAWDPFVKNLAWRAKKLASGLLDGWKRADELEAVLDKIQHVKDGDALQLAEFRKLLLPAKKLAESVGVPQLLVGSLTRLNAGSQRRGQTRPGFGEVRARADEESKRWATFIATAFETPQRRLIMETGSAEALSASTFLMRLLAKYRQRLLYMAGGDPPHLSSSEAMHIHRIRFAQWMRVLARVFEWSPVTDAANEILAAKLEKDHIVAILPQADGKYWKADNGALEKLAEVVVIKSWEPLTGAALVAFYQAEAMRGLATEIAKRRPADDAEEDRRALARAAMPYIISDADKAVRGLPQPHRWFIPSANYEFALQEKRAFDPSAMLRQHESYATEIQPHEKETGWLSMLPTSFAGGLWAWFLPYPSQVIPILRKVTAFNGLVAKRVPVGTTVAARLDAVKSLADAEWWAHLKAELTRPKAFDEKQIAAFHELALEAFRDDRFRAQEKLRLETKYALRFDRRLVAGQVRDKLAKFNENKLHTWIGREAIEIIDGFAIATSRLWQFGKKGEFITEIAANAALTALLLDLARDLLESFSRAETFDIVHGLVGHLEVAAETIDTLVDWPAAQRQQYLHPSEDKPTWIEPRRKDLAEITTHFREARERVMESRGFYANAAKKQLEIQFRYAKPLPVGTDIYPREGGLLGDPTRQYFRFVDILQSFTFHPEYGYGGAGLPQPKGRRPRLRSGSVKAIFLNPDGTPVAPDTKLLRVKVMRREPGKKLGKLVRNVDLTPKDAELFADFYNGVTYWAFGSAMGTALDIVEAQIMLFVDVLEMIPGWGKIITAAKVAYAVVDFFGSGGAYDDIVELFRGGLHDVAEGLYERIQDAADPTNLIDLLLFGDQRLDYILAHSTLGRRKDDVANSSTSRSKLGKAIRAFARLGKALFRSMRKLHDGVHVPMQDFRGFVATRPVLSFAFHFAADHIYTLAKLGHAAAIYAMADDDDWKSGPGAKGRKHDAAKQDFVNDLKVEQKGVGAKVNALLGQLRQLELPKQIIDMKPIYMLVMQELFDTAARAIGTEARFVEMVLKRTGLLDALTGEIADTLIGYGLDPNIYWRDTIVPALATRFTEARDALVSEINGALQSKAFAGAFSGIDAGKPITLDPKGEPFEELRENYDGADDDAGTDDVPDAAPFVAPGTAANLKPDGVPAIGAGSTLPDRLREKLERSFGQDLGHVRLHRGQDAAAMTASFNVQGLATGSHVFLKPGLGTESQQGDRVMRHEIAHVLQTSGPRVRGMSGGTSPIAGRPQAGLDLDPARERDAHRMADASVLGDRVSSSAGFAGAGGLAPFEIDPYTVSKLLRKASNLHNVLKSAESVDKPVSAVILPTPARDAVDNVLKTLHGITGLKAPVLSFAGVFEQAMPHIEARFKGKEGASTHARLRLESLRELAKEALKDAKSASAGATPEQYLPGEHFAREVEAYVLAKTGIALGIKLREKKISVGGSTVNAVDATNPIEQIKVLFIHMPLIDGRSPLWKDLMENTWVGNDSATVDRRGRARGIVRDLLSARGISIAVFAAFGKKFALSGLIKKDVDQLINVGSGALAPAHLPDFKSYASTTSSGVNHIGLRIENYGAANQTAPGRESHHTTQYLLAEYFANQTADDQKAFRPGRDYPGVKMSSDVVQSISASDTASGTDVGQSILVATTYGSGSDRGKAMPSISLAAVTHRRGGLHVTPEADDLANQMSPKKSTQAYAVHNRFRTLLPKPLRGESADTEFKAYVDAQGRDTVAKQIHAAAQRTYRWMERDMSDKLKDSMAQLEFDYYIGLCTDNPNKAVDISENAAEKTAFRTLLDAIPAIARAHNDKVMKTKLGWKRED
jgi:hypothetical protein